MKNLADEELRQQLNLETGKLSWEELQRHFARGAVIIVTTELDLIDVAVKFAKDDKPAIESWIKNDVVARATDADALRWSNSEPVFWAIVTAPWVLVQEITIQ